MLSQHKASDGDVSKEQNGRRGFNVINWNVGGAKFLRLPPNQRSAFERQFNNELRRLCLKWRPDVILLQEVVRTRRGDATPVDIIEPPPGYCYQMQPIHDSDSHSHPVRWRKYRASGHHSEDEYIGQGSGFLWREDLKHASLWDYATTNSSCKLNCELVPINTGLFTGDRDTEPRGALVAHFVSQNDREEDMHIFVVNVHLSTLHGEREHHVLRDRLGKSIRLQQLRTVLEEIVTRHVGWSQLLDLKVDLSNVLWVIGGDFNAGPKSEEIELMRAFGFCDATPNKGRGNKSSGFGNNPTHTADYVFVNYLQSWSQMQYAFEQYAASSPEPDLTFRSSDHYPTIARLPISSVRHLEAVR